MEGLDVEDWRIDRITQLASEFRSQMGRLGSMHLTSANLDLRSAGIIDPLSDVEALP